MVALVDTSRHVRLDTSPTWIVPVTSNNLMLVVGEPVSGPECLLKLSLSTLLTRQSSATAFPWPVLLLLGIHIGVPYQIVLQVVCC